MTVFYALARFALYRNNLILFKLQNIHRKRECIVDRCAAGNWKFRCCITVQIIYCPHSHTRPWFIFLCSSNNNSCTPLLFSRFAFWTAAYTLVKINFPNAGGVPIILYHKIDFSEQIFETSKTMFVGQKQFTSCHRINLFYRARKYLRV